MSTGETRVLIGECETFKAVMRQVGLVAPASCAVLVQGETGTGKELVARAIHDQSARSSGPFVTLNCAAIPAGLLESELFGHERGAFTGALAQRMGRFQLANKGTLFLDEIGDMPLELQSKLLRALQEQEFERLGSSRTIQVDVRVVAATNQDLLRMVKDRRFRADLYYRLNVFPILLPPLRERGEDIPQLVRHFVRLFCARMNKQIEEIPERVMEVLRHYDWPGNIRELQNCIERAVILAEDGVLRAPISELVPVTPVEPRAPHRTLVEIERTHIAETLRRTNGVVGGPDGAAARLGLPRTTLLSRMHKLGITRKGRRHSRVVPFPNSAAQVAAADGQRAQSLAGEQDDWLRERTAR